MPIDRPSAWIFDVDGTLALIGDRSPYDMRSVSIDTPQHPVVMAAQALAAHPDVDALIVVSGRDETARRATEAWLTFNGIPFDRLLLRATGDQRADSIVKAEIYDTFIAPHFTVIGVVDDRRSVVEMWRSRGLVCFQVAEGDFQRWRSGSRPCLYRAELKMRIDRDPADDLAAAEVLAKEHELGTDAEAQVAHVREALKE